MNRTSASYATVLFVAFTSAGGCIGTDVGNPVQPDDPVRGADAGFSPAPDDDFAPVDGGAGGAVPEPPASDAGIGGEFDSLTDATTEAGHDDADTSAPAPEPFEPFPSDDGRLDPRTDRLCTEQAGRMPSEDEPITVDCRVIGGSFAPEGGPLDVPSELVVFVWNVERGLRVDEQLDALLSSSDLPRPDILLLSELDRGCSRTDYRDITREYAEALEMYWVFATEFVELPREGGAGGRIDEVCEHGNAILSRFPLGNVEARFHRSNQSWFLPPDAFNGVGENRLGGRSFVRADTLVGERVISLYSVHFESNVNPIDVQADQAREVAEHAAERPNLAIIGGDTNAPTYWIDIRRGRAASAETVTDATVRALLSYGMEDVHRDLPYEARTTRGGLVLDLLLANGGVWEDAAVCPSAVCDSLSDHRAVWATLRLDEEHAGE
jgi:endonuclease/exonuclease/phosphatase family metal-dependent hydrolase